MKVEKVQKTMKMNSQAYKPKYGGSRTKAGNDPNLNVSIDKDEKHVPTTVSPVGTVYQMNVFDDC